MKQPTDQEIDLVLEQIKAELKRAVTKHPSHTRSSHHHLAVTEEELHEARLAVYADDFAHAKKEMLSVGAMAARYILEAQDEKITG